MATTTSNGFGDDFTKLLPLIRDEWPAVEADALEQTGGDYERVVALIAERTERTRTLVKRQIEELREVARREEGRNGTGNGATFDAARIQQMMQRLQDKSGEIAEYVRKQMLADARDKVGQNLLTSMLFAIGLGFVLGFLLRGLGRGRDHG